MFFVPPCCVLQIMKGMDGCYVVRATNNENHQSVSNLTKGGSRKKKTKKTKKNKNNKKTKKRKKFCTPVLCVANYERNGWVKDVVRCKGHQQ